VILGIYGIDRKGRVILPIPWRSKGSLVATALPGGVLAVQTIQAYAAMLTGAEGDAWLYLSHATAPLGDCDLTTGRVLLPAAIRDRLGFRYGMEVVWWECETGLRLMPYVQWDAEVAAREPIATAPRFPLPRAVEAVRVALGTEPAEKYLVAKGMR
jgi:DNA-binding transcriptional regulator/RsmH inhibitor MraZ